jgi:hypothetical protein
MGQRAGSFATEEGQLTAIGTIMVAEYDTSLCCLTSDATNSASSGAQAGRVTTSPRQYRPQGDPSKFNWGV